MSSEYDISSARLFSQESSQLNFEAGPTKQAEHREQQISQALAESEDEMDVVNQPDEFFSMTPSEIMQHRWLKLIEGAIPDVDMEDTRAVLADP